MKNPDITELLSKLVEIPSISSLDENQKDVLDSANFIAAHIGMEVSKTITVDSEQKGSLLCEVKSDDEPSRTGWYDIEDVIGDIPESCELMILNRADNPSDQYGVTKHLSLLQRSAMIAVTGIEDPSQHGLALRIAQICRGFIRIDSVVFKRGRKTSIAIIEPAQSVKTPPPMPYPSIARLLPKKLHIDHHQKKVLKQLH